MGNTECFYKSKIKINEVQQSSLYQTEFDNEKEENQQNNNSNMNESVSPNKTKITRYKKKMSIDDFEQIRILGKGGFGVVMLCNYKKEHKLYAIKIIKKKDIFQKSMEQSTFLEKNILQKNECDFIIHLKYAFQDSKRIYLVMEYIEGGELYQLIKKYKCLNEVMTAFYLSEIIIGLEYLHNKLNVIYRDIKPENILLTKNGHIKLTDFGLSKITQEKSYTFAGTPEYLAPEIILNQGYNKQIDIWSLGILCFEMISGKAPFVDPQRNIEKIQKKILENRPQFKSNIFSDSATNLIKSLLQIQPCLRPSIEEIKKDPFFSGIDWDKMSKREVNPPLNDLYAPISKNLQSHFRLNDQDPTMPHLINFTYNSESKQI